MAYGAIKVDDITFTNGGADQATTVSGIYRAITSGVTVTGTISGVTIQGTTVSGTTVTGTTANFTSGVFTVLSGASTTFTSGIFAAGSAAAPSISFTSDPNTGIYSPGADQVAISSSGTGRLFVNSSGNVGIGTSASGSFRLDVQGGPVRILEQGAGSSLEIGQGTTTSQNAFIDLIGDTTYTDYGFRMQRADSGPNALSILEHRGTGDFVVRAQEAAPITFYTTNAERFRITSAGNVGINTSSPSYTLDVNGLIRGIGSSTALLASNGSGSGQTSIGLRREGGATDQKTWEFLTGASGEFKIRTINDTYTGSEDAFAINRGSGFGVSSVLFATGGSERLRIDSSGRLLVGTSSARSNFFNAGNTALFQVEGTGETAAIRNLNDNFGAMLLLGKSRSTSNTIVQNDDNVGLLTFQGNDGTEFVECAAILAYIDGTPGANDMPGRLVFSTTADGATSPTERLRIDSAGTVIVNGTSSDPIGVSANQVLACGPGASAGALNYYNSSQVALKLGRGNDGQLVTFFRNQPSAIDVGNIAVTTTATAYNTSSDYRLKENVVSLTGAVERLNQLQVHRFNFLADPAKTVDGFIAHEAQAVVPECVTGNKDAVDEDGKPIYQGIDQSKLVPLLTAALQEAVAKIETLEARLTAAGIK